MTKRFEEKNRAKTWNIYMVKDENVIDPPKMLSDTKQRNTDAK